MRKLLLVSLLESDVLPQETHRFLAQRLVLKAVADTRAVDVTFWDCPDLAQSFGAESGSGHPDLRGFDALSVLGRPSWLEIEGTPWTEVLIPLASMAGYERTRIKPVTFEVAQLIVAGLSARVATNLLEASGTLDQLKWEAKRVDKEMLQGGKITKISKAFKRKKDVALILSMRDINRTKVTMYTVLDLFGDARASNDSRS